MKRNEKGIEGRATVLLLANKIRTTRQLSTTLPPTQAAQPTPTLAWGHPIPFPSNRPTACGTLAPTGTTGRGDGDSPSTLNPVEGGRFHSCCPRCQAHAMPCPSIHTHVLPPPLPCNLRFPFDCVASFHPVFFSLLCISNPIYRSYISTPTPCVCLSFYVEGRSFPVPVRLSGFFGEWSWSWSYNVLRSAETSRGKKSRSLAHHPSLPYLTLPTYLSPVNHTSRFAFVAGDFSSAVVLPYLQLTYFTFTIHSSSPPPSPSFSPQPPALY